MADLQALQDEMKVLLAQTDTLSGLEALRISWLGRKGKIADLFRQMGAVSAEERPALGQALNQLKTFAEQVFDERLAAIKASGASVSRRFDPTLPGISKELGRLHPITKTIRDITNVFKQLGFEIVSGREIETEFHNFTALNIPLDHPSRDGFDTFYTKSGHLLRSQTSTVQIRVMESRKPPLRIVAPGRVYRPDAVDASHSFMFHQIEGLMVDDRTTFADLKGVLNLFLKKLFGSDIQMRFRPHHFPFTEPSVEIDVSWGKGWLEVLGAGQVNPAVFRAVGYNPKNVQGFAFGLGVERIAMLKYGIKDIRLFYENDLRFLKQF